MEIVIREYMTQDKEFLTNATEKLHDYVVALDPLQRLRKMPGYITHTLDELLTITEKQEGKIYIAEYEGKPVGFVAGFTTKQSETNLLSVVPTKVGVMSDLYVDENFRGKHIGTALLGKIEAHLKAMDCDTIWLNIVAFNTNAHDFYNQMGYVDREIGLIKKIT